MILKEKMTLGFCESDPGTEPDIWAEVVRIDPDGSCALYFPACRAIYDYIPWVIQAGIFTGEIIVKRGEMMEQIHRDRIEALCADLESGEHEQGRFYLHLITSEGKDRWCCLGRACIVAIAGGCEVGRKVISANAITAEIFGGSSDVLPAEVMEYFGLTEGNPYLFCDDGHRHTATHLNDFGADSASYDFPAIARAFRRTFLEGNDGGD